MQRIPLHLDAPSDPTRRRAIVGGIDFHAAIQMHRALAILVIAEGLDGQRQQRRPFFGKHRRHLTLGGAVNARIGPPLFPAIQVGLRLFEGLETQAFQWRFLGMGNPRLDLPFSIWIRRATRQCDGAVMPQHIAVQRVQHRIVDIRRQYALTQVIEHHHPGDPSDR